MGSEGGGKRGEAEDDQVSPIGEAAAVAVAEESGEEGSQHHADEGYGNKLGVLRERLKKPFLELRRERSISRLQFFW